MPKNTPQNQKKLKNHQLLETCGVQMFKKIQRKNIIETAKAKSGNLLKPKK